MPPKMLTRMPLTLGSERMMRNASIAPSGVDAAADVEEVGGVAAVVLDDVHRAHRQAGPVDEAADVAVELNVVELGLAGPHFGRVLFGHRASRRFGMAEQGVVVEVESWRRWRPRRLPW